MKRISVRDIDGFLLGHATDAAAGTGCTVVLYEKGAVAGVDVRGGGPATRETDLLRPENLVERIHAVLLTGGSAFGLDAAGGVMEYLERRGVGFDTGFAHVPIVCAAALFDLGLGSATVRPDHQMGLTACGYAGMPSSVDLLEGNVGAGTGCSVGKMRGPGHAAKSGIGISGLEIDGLQVAVVVACNAMGSIMAEDGTVLVGPGARRGGSADAERMLLDAHRVFAMLMHGSTDWSGTGDGFAEDGDLEADGDVASENGAAPGVGGSSGTGTGAADEGTAGTGFADAGAAEVMNTTIGCIVTNARLTKAQANKVASMAHDGLVRAINPVHTSNDGDTLFCMASGVVPASVDEVGMIAARVVEEAVRRSALTAWSAYGLHGLAG